MRRKITFVLILLLLAFAAVVVKLAVIQFVQGDELQQKAEELRTRDLPVSASRGDICDRNGNRLAISITADSVSASPPDVINSGEAEKSALFLSQVLELDYDEVLSDITSDKSFVWVKRKVDFDIAQAIEDEEFTGVNIVEETQRYYPKSTLASQLLGFCGVDNQGLEGVEIAFDDWLSGKDGRVVSEYDGIGQAIPQAEYEYIAPTDGYDVYLTIDENIQYFCERELDTLMASEIKPKSASIIMMRPETGEILAMAISPGYDVNDYKSADSSVRRNTLISDSYEPGSCFKIITASAALEEGTINTNSTFYDPGYALVAGQKIKCWRSYNPHGSQTLVEAFQNSCNPAFVKIGQSIEAKEKGLFYKYIEAYGFGQTTGIELSGEAPGIMIDEDALGPVEVATISIGQGIAVTPLQMVTAVSAVANGGTLLEPQIVSKVVNSNGDVVQEYETKKVRQVISSETSELMRSLLENVVANGTGKKAYIEGYRVAGKTGTAQKAGNGGYAAGKYVASFIGMAPANDPEIVCLVVIDEPSGGLYQGGQIAAPIFKAVVEDTLRYLGVTPQVTDSEVDKGSDSKSTVEVPDITNLNADAATELLDLIGLKSQVKGNGTIVASQVPAAGSSLAAGGTVILNCDNSTTVAGKITVPDLTGKKLSEVAKILSAMGLKLVAKGSDGIAIEQSPQPLNKVTAGSTVTVKFKVISDEEESQSVGP